MSKTNQIEQLDSFIFCLRKALIYYKIDYSPEIIYGLTGFGARFTLSMNVKSGKEIGHPSSEYIWDVISVVEYCFNELDIECEIYIDGGYLTSARSTSADNYTTPEFVKHLTNNQEIPGPLFYAHKTGQWIYSEHPISSNTVEADDLPFGRIILSVRNVKQKSEMSFPITTLSYLIRTLERGEEPMEITGLGNYSALSGWKAYARWMQAYSLPIRGIKHDTLGFLGKQLVLRRYFNYKFWELFSSVLRNSREIKFASELAQCYREIYEYAEQMIQNGQSYQNIKQLYYLEQKTLPIYKEINHYINS